MSEHPVQLTVERRVAYVTLDRPERLNAIDESVLEGLESALHRIEADPELCALVVTGAGDRAFSVGLDLDLLERAFGDLDYWEATLRRLNACLLRLERLDVPVIAAVNGLARAGGYELALACDLMVVTEAARIGDAHTTFGVPPGGGATARLPRRIGLQRATELILTGRWLDASEAVAIGLAWRAVPAGGLTDAVEELLDALRRVPPRTLAAVKRSLRRGAGSDVAAAVEVEIEEFLAWARDMGDEAGEGFRAYRERRPPRWRGVTGP
jgi:enoyl-CoA hydratase/carnithine racemase